MTMPSKAIPRKPSTKTILLEEKVLVFIIGSKRFLDFNFKMQDFNQRLQTNREKYLERAVDLTIFKIKIGDLL